MAITPDGTAPRLRLGLDTRGTPSRSDDRDFAYDGQVIVHEYGHGVNNRQVGGGTSTSCLTGFQSDALDEGWSDYWAASYFNDPVQSSYLARPGTGGGVRRASYEGYKLTYEDLGNVAFESHLDGELWAATLWDIRKALGASTADRLVYTALRLTPCRPSFIQARDAILAADQAINNGANRAKLYQVFANHGMGASASGFDGNAESGTVFNAAFDLPPDLQSGNRGPSVSSRPPAFVVAGQPFTYRIDATDPDGGTLRYEVSAGPPGLTVDAATGVVQWTPQFTSTRVKIVITDGQGGRVIHGFGLPVITALTLGRPTSISASTSGGIATVDVPEGAPVLQVTLRDGTGSAGFILVDPDGFPDFDDPHPGQSQTLSVSTPAPGTWFVVVAARTPFQNVQLMASLPEPKLIPANGILNGLSGVPSSETFYRIVVPPGGNGLQVKLTGGSGDGDLVIRRDRPPVCQVFEEAVSARCFASDGSFRFGNNEVVEVASPQSGNWYVNVTSASGYAGAALTTSLNVQPTLTVSQSKLTFTMLEGGAAPAPQTVSVADPSGKPYTWAAAVQPATATWLSISPKAGTADGPISVSVSPTGLQPGAYTATIQVTAPGLSQTPQNIQVTFTINRRPIVNASAAQLDFTAPQGSDPTVQNLAINNSGGGSLEWTVTAATNSGGAWLSVDQPRGTGDARLQVIVRSKSLDPGTYQGTLTVAATNAATVTVSVRLVVTPGGTIREDTLRSFASKQPVTAIVPGDLLVLNGSGLTNAGSAADPSGIALTINDAAAQLLLVTATEIRFVVPLVTTGAEARISVTRQGVQISSFTRPVGEQNLGIFTVLDNGTGAGQFFHADDSPVTRSAPLFEDEVASLFAGGLGAVTSADPLAPIAHPIRVFLDGVEAAVDVAYLEPVASGIYRVRFRVPAGLARKLPVVILQSDTSQSPEVSAGGASLLDGTATRTADGITLKLTGVNLAAGSVVRIGEETFNAEIGGGAQQTATVTIPARAASDISVRIENPADPAEAPSNSIIVKVP